MVLLLKTLLPEISSKKARKTFLVKTENKRFLQTITVLEMQSLLREREVFRIPMQDRYINKW